MSMLKTKSSLLLIIFMAFVMIISAGCINTPSREPNDDPPIPEPPATKTTINIIGFGDSISAGYALSGSDMYDAYVSYTSGTTEINSMCYTNLIAQSFDDDYETINVKSYANSGDKTQDLISKLNDNETYPTLETDVQNADIITLCIGANNVLGVALDNLIYYLLSAMSLDDINALLDQGVAQFKQDYTNTIIPYLTQGNGKVYVMTIYDPYKYFDTAEIEITGENAINIQGIQNMLTNFNTLKQTAIEHLNELNNYIKNQNIDNVIVVDVNASMETLDKITYRQYINADSSQVTINSENWVSDLMSFQSSPNFDPHPTSQGQQYIANLFLQEINQTEEANQE